MPWKSNDPDPLEARRRQLEELQKNLSEQRRKLSEQLQPGGEATVARAKQVEPLVWRTEEDGARNRVSESAPARKRHLARQRQRDMIVAISLIVLFLIVLSIVLWVYYVHNTSGGNGA